MLVFLRIVAELSFVFFIAHQSIITIASWFVRKKEEADVSDPGTRFICLVCAHNEETVVAQSVKTLLAQDYPENLFEVVVIADNCSDATAEVAHEAGATVWERFDSDKKSKGYALEWAFQRIFDEDRGFEFVCVFDADNLVSPNFLAEMDRSIQRGGTVLQGYLDSKNPSDSWISKSYAFSYWATNRIFQLAREKLGLSAQLGGTGMCVSLDVLKEHPWGTQSMTEDLEYVARYVISSGLPVRWVHEAKVYDEKPLKMKPSFVQRTRWARGHVECAIKYSGSLVKSAVNSLRKGEVKSAIIALDVLIYLIQPARMIITMLTVSAFLITFFINDFQLSPLSLFYLALVIVYYGIPIVGIIQEKKAYSIKWFAQVHVFALSWVFVMAVALFSYRKKTWNKTEHTRSVSIEELRITENK